LEDDLFFLVDEPVNQSSEDGGRDHDDEQHEHLRAVDGEGFGPGQTERRAAVRVVIGRARFGAGAGRVVFLGRQTHSASVRPGLGRLVVGGCVETK